MHFRISIRPTHLMCHHQNFPVPRTCAYCHKKALCVRECVRVYTYVYIHRPTFVYTYIHTYILHACIHRYMHTYIIPRPMYIHVYIHTYTRTHIHTYIHTYTHTHTHTHTHLLSKPFSFLKAVLKVFFFPFQGSISPGRMDCLTLEYGTDVLSRPVAIRLPSCAE